MKDSSHGLHVLGISHLTKCCAFYPITDDLVVYGVSHLTAVTWVQIPAGAFERFDLKSLPPQYVGTCGPSPGFKWPGALGKLLKSHTAPLRKSQTWQCQEYHSDSDTDRNITNVNFHCHHIGISFSKTDTDHHDPCHKMSVRATIQ